LTDDLIDKETQAELEKRRRAECKLLAT